MKKKKHINKPCDNCPFRSDGPFNIGGLRRAPEIADTLRDYSGSFQCHKTTRSTGNGTMMECVGAMKVILNEDRTTQLMQIMHRLKMVDLHKIKAEPTPVYEDLAAWERAMLKPYEDNDDD